MDIDDYFIFVLQYLIAVVTNFSRHAQVGYTGLYHTFPGVNFFCSIFLYIYFSNILCRPPIRFQLHYQEDSKFHSNFNTDLDEQTRKCPSHGLIFIGRNAKCKGYLMLYHVI